MCLFYGTIHIDFVISQIPYTVTKNEIIAAVGRTARLVSQPPGSPFYAIHIIMERSSGKTNDCFVEVESPDEVRLVISNFERRCMSNRAPRIGDRPVYVEKSSHEELMRELFLRARCVHWEGQIPHVYETEEMYNSGFNGFVTEEEMFCTRRHAKAPNRVSDVAL